MLQNQTQVHEKMQAVGVKLTAPFRWVVLSVLSTLLMQGSQFDRDRNHERSDCYINHVSVQTSTGH